MFLRSTLMLVLALGACCSCSQPPDLAPLIADYASLLNETNYLACSCPLILGYSTSVECDDAVGTVSEPERACMSSVLEGSEEEGQSYLECMTVAYTDYSLCLESNVDCEQTLYEACSSELTAATSSCPKLESHADFAACTAI